MIQIYESSSNNEVLNILRAHPKLAVEKNLTEHSSKEQSKANLKNCTKEEFDEFTNLSHHGAINISLEAQRNRFFLLGIMTTAGWDFYIKEWWHYQLFNSKKYKLINNRMLKKPIM